MRKQLLLVAALLVCLVHSLIADEVTKTKMVWERPVAPAADAKLLKVHFIDVGGGDGILIETPTDKKILIDGGFTWSERGKARKEYEAYLDKFLQNDIVDLIVITHPDYDHFGGLSDILDSHVVRQVWASGYDSEQLSSSWNKLRTKLENDKDTLFISPLGRHFGLGSVFRFDHANTFKKSDDTVLTLINTRKSLPNKAYGSMRTLNEAQKRNSTSIVLRMDFGKTSFLFTGDVNGRKKGAPINACDDQEKFMVDNNNNPQNVLFKSLDCDILKVAHHGSDGSSSLPFLKAVSPKWAVVPAGHPHGHPHQGPLNRLKHPDVGLDDDHILRTDEDDPGTKGTEENLGDDCFIFTLDPDGIVKIEKWNVKVE